MRTLARVLPLLLLAACTNRLVAMAPLSAPATSYECASAVDAATCLPATVLDPATVSQSGAVTIVLPPECRGSFEAIVLRHRRSAKRDALVTCGPEGTAPGPFACAALPDDYEPSLEAEPDCVPATEAEASDSGLGLALPAQCDGHANTILVERLRAGTPGSRVVCAAPDNQPGSTP